jgi:F0F1-type ATP synthase assembly protein I
MRSDSAHQQVASAINEGWIEGGSFFGSTVAGMLIGLGVDAWLGTEPWFVIGGILLGAYSGFLHVWHYSKKLEEMPRDR